MSRLVRRQTTRKTAAKGFTLVELMVSMVLGLVVIGAVVSVLMANKRTFDTTSAMSGVQEGARTAFELLARDLRQAGVSGCDNNGRVANVLSIDPTLGAKWWQTWFGLAGYDATQTDPAVATGTGVGQRVNGTHSFQVQGITGNGMSVTSNDAVAATFTINAAATDVVANDVLVACDFDHAAVFQVSSYDDMTVTIKYDTGNCTTGLGFPTNCAAGVPYPFPRNAQVSHMSAVDWYIGNNGRASEAGRSLYRLRLDHGAADTPEEIVAGVSDMRIGYRIDGTDSFVSASDANLTATNWRKVNAVSITLTMNSAQQRVSSNAAVNSGRLQRTFTWLVTLRNRAQ